MAKFCTNCGKELDDNAAICLNCGVIVDNKPSNNNSSTKKEKNKGLPTWAIVLIVIGCVFIIPIVIFVAIGVFAYNIISDSDINFDDYLEETTTQKGTIGDTLKSDTFRIVLTDALIYDSIGSEEGYIETPAEGKEYLVFFFNIENVSEESKYISSYSFRGYVDGYTISNKYLFNDIDGVKKLGEDLAPNMKTIGYVAFEVDKNWKEFELRYNDWLDNGELIFTVVNEDSNAVPGA